MDRAETKENLKMKRLTITLLTLLVLGGCSSDNEDLKRKVLDLEKTILVLEETIEEQTSEFYQQEKIKELNERTRAEIEKIKDRHAPYYELVNELKEKCTSKEEVITTFGVYTLNQKTTDQDCFSELTGGRFGSAPIMTIIRSPAESLLTTGRELHVEDIGEFFHISGYSGGAWCCEEDHFLSKKAPYEIVFEEHSKAGTSVLWRHFDSDIYKEIRIVDTNFIQWLGCTACSALPVIYLEYSSDSFKLDKELMYSEVSEKIKNIPESIEFHGTGLNWKDHDIPTEFVEIIAQLAISGREDEARKFYDDIFPDLPKKELFWQEFKEKLARSKYWELEVWESTDICDWFDPNC